MLKSLYIRNYVIIEELSIDFEGGMSVFTGETGAGKSIIIDALSLLCGERLSTNVLRDPEKKAFIEAVFSLEHADARHFLMDAGFEDIEEAVISREISPDLKSTMRLNYRGVTQNFVREFTSQLLDIHNQHETQYLLNNKSHLGLLDRYSNDTSLLREVNQAYKAYIDKKRELDQALKSEFNVEDRDYLLYQKEEIEKVNTYEGEKEELEEKERVLMNFEKTSNALNSVISSLDGSGGSLENLYSAIRELNDLNEKNLSEHTQKIHDLYYELLDQTEYVKDYYNALSYDEGELNYIQNRLFEIRKLTRKYGESYQDIQESYQNIVRRMEMIDHRDEVLADLRSEVERLLSAYKETAASLSRFRKEKAICLEKDISEELKELELENTCFKISFVEKEPARDGTDKVEFLISTNTGQALQPLVNVASGGELSRIMLGLKTIFNQLQGIETVVFDEIDTGVSGSIASSIGLKMHEISRNAQVYAVTHLAQVAACADQHYFVSKSSDNNSTTTKVTLLNKEERIKELANISTGTNTELALKSAQELFDNSQKRIQKC